MTSTALETVKEIVTSSATALSGVYASILLTTGVAFEGAFLNLEAKVEQSFLCKGAADKFDVGLCRTNYNNGPNKLHRWVYHAYLIVPAIIFTIEAAVRRWKVKNPSKKEECRLHIHVIYFLRLAILVLVYFLLIVLIAIKSTDLSMKPIYHCMDGNSTFKCVDSEVESKTSMNIACFFFTIFLCLFLVVEFVYYGCRWLTEVRTCDKDIKDHCWKCYLFDKEFGKGDSSQDEKEGDLETLDGQTQNLPRHEHLAHPNRGIIKNTNE